MRTVPRQRNPYQRRPAAARGAAAKTRAASPPLEPRRGNGQGVVGIADATGMGDRRATIISLEGNIGVGKSTLLTGVCDALKKEIACGRVVVLHEPIQELTDCGLLAAMYNGDVDMVAFQVAMLSARMKQMLLALQRDNVEVVVTERSMDFGDALFAETHLAPAAAAGAHSRGTFNYTAYKVALANHVQTLPVHNKQLLLLDTDVDTLLHRIGQRARHAEDAISREYLQTLREKHGERYATWPHAKQLLDASATSDALQERVCRIVKEALAAEHERAKSPDVVHACA